MNYNNEIIQTSDGKSWLYDFKHHEWVDVALNPKLKQLLKNSVKLDDEEEVKTEE